MASLLDSEAQFIQRTIDLKLSDELKRGLVRAGLKTFGTFAYAHGQPGQNISDESFETWVTGQLLTGATIADIAGAKRLLFESQTIVLASLQDQVNTTDSSAIKKVPIAERESKMRAIKKRLTGLLIEGPLEPGHGLLDTTASMMQLNEIKYIPPEKCISRTHEVMNQKSPTKQLDISAENLIVKEKQDTPDMTVTSALQVQEALQRRGIALVFADLITHESYTRYLTTLFGHLHRDPPAGYARTTVSQLVSADKTVWQMLLEEGVQPKRDEMGTLALDTKLMESLQSYRVSFSLLPLIAKRDNAPSPTKTSKTATSHGGKGATASVLQCKSLGSSPRVERKVEKGKFVFPTIFSSWVVQLRIPLVMQFALDLTAALGVQMQRMVQNAGEDCTSVQSAMVYTVSKNMNQVDSVANKIAVGALPVIHQIDVWKLQSVFQIKILQS